MEKNIDPICDTYKSIAAPAEGLFKDNGSRFIALAYPVETVEQIREIVSSLKKEYHDARHHCYAYRLGYKGDVFRANDDGEPSSSAGRPILGQIDSNCLSDILIVVVRLFRRHQARHTGTDTRVQELICRRIGPCRNHNQNSDKALQAFVRLYGDERGDEDSEGYGA